MKSNGGRQQPQQPAASIPSRIPVKKSSTPRTPQAKPINKAESYENMMISEAIAQENPFISELKACANADISESTKVINEAEVQEEICNVIEDNQEVTKEKEPCEIVISACEANTDTKALLSKLVPKPKWSLSHWLNMPVYLEYYQKATDSIVLERVPVPHLRLFKADQVEKAIVYGKLEMARVMLETMMAPTQMLPNSAALKSTKLIQLKHRLEERLLAGSSIEDVPVPTLPVEEPNKHEDRELFEDLEAEELMQREIEEVIGRNSVALEITPPQFRSVRKAATMILDNDMMGSVRKRLFAAAEPPKTDYVRRTNRRLLPDATKGTQIKFALLTPSKRVKEILHTDQVISPVRRSARHLEGEPLKDGKRCYFDSIGEFDMTNEDIGYLPNKAVDLSDASCTATPTKKRPNNQNGKSAH